jgi:glycosyltransferase involved in cell wall biosynthesis
VPFTYVLISAVRNEERYLSQTITSVIAQTIRPVKWIIVSDNSTDATLEIASSFVIEYPFIEVVPHVNGGLPGFASKVHALQQAVKLLSEMEYDFIGVLDGDISLTVNYYELLLNRFFQNPKLGLAGGILFDVCNGQEFDRKSSPWSVPGGIQFFRKQCFQDLGGFIPSKYGGEDTILEVLARMHSWEVHSFKDLKGWHWKTTGYTQGSLPVYAFNQGRRDYACGITLVFEIFKSYAHLHEKPFGLHVPLRIAGFIWSILRKDERLLPRSYIRYYRDEQMSRLRDLMNPIRLMQKTAGH